MPSRSFIHLMMMVVYRTQSRTKDEGPGRTKNEEQGRNEGAVPENNKGTYKIHATQTGV